MEIKLKNTYNDGSPVNIGDKVTFLNVFNDSGSAIDLYGVEPHLDSWISVIYVDTIEGEVVFDEKSLMVVIKAGNRNYPLSTNLRVDRNHQIFEEIDKDSIDEVKIKLGVENLTPDMITDYLIKL